MSHVLLLLEGKPLDAPEHLTLAQERLTECERKHEKRRRRVRWERDLIANRVWPASMSPTQRRLTPPTAHTIASTTRAMLLPKEPDITILPLSQDEYAGSEADAVERWMYAMLTHKRAWAKFRKQGGEITAAGMGAMHIQPDPMALKNKEVPVLLDVPMSENVVWSMGPRDTPDQVFIKHSFTQRQLRERFGYTDRSASNDETVRTNCWCYYCEERYIDKATGEVHQMILYMIFDGRKIIVPLTDITLIFGEIPVVLSFSGDGWDWENQEEMHALGVLSPATDLLIYSIDYMTQLGNSQMRTINPPIVVESNTGAQPPVLDLGPLKQNNLVNGEKVHPLIDVQPNPQTIMFHQQVVMPAIANGTLHQVIEPAEDLEGVSGSALSENMSPTMLRMRVQQDSFASDIGYECGIIQRHVATRINPKTGMRLLGADPRDRSQIDILMFPEMLLAHTYIDVQLSNETPRNVFLMSQLLQTLATAGIIPTQLAAETIVKWLDLSVRDMSSLMKGLEADMLRKMHLQQAESMVQQSVLPQLQNAAKESGVNPAMLHRNQSPYPVQTRQRSLTSEGMDPLLAGQARQIRSFAAPQSLRKPVPQLGGPR